MPQKDLLGTYRYVTCTFGPDALIDDHMSAFREFGIKRVLLTEAALAPKLMAAGWDQRACERQPTIIRGKPPYGGPALVDPATPGARDLVPPWAVQNQGS